MPSYAQLEDGSYFEIPDDAKPEDIPQLQAQAQAVANSSNAPSSQQPEGFWGALGRTLKEQNIDPMARMVMDAFHAQQSGGASGLQNYLMGLPPAMAAGAWQQSLPHTQAAIQAAQQGNIPQMLGQGIYSLPVIGPQLANTFKALADYSNAPAATKAQRGGEALGQVMTTGAQVLPEEALEALGSPIRAAAAPYYRKIAGFPTEMSIDEAKAAAQLAVKHDIPLGGFMGIYGSPDSTIAKLGHGKAGIIGDNMAEVQKLVNANASKQLNMDTVLGPVNDQIQQLMAAPAGRQQAEQLQTMVHSWLKDHGLGIYDHQTGALVGWKPIGMRQAQEMKQAAYGILPSGMFSDTKDGLGAVQKEFNKLIAKGLRQGQNDLVPEMATYNDTVHNAINLRNRVEELDKKGLSFGWPELTALGVGGATGMIGPASGHPLMFSPEALAMGGMTYALTKPQSASRIATAMGDVGRGPISRGVLANLPRAAALTKGGQDFVDSVNKATGIQPTKKPDVSGVPVAKNIPLSQVPFLIENSAKAQGVDPALAKAVASVESDFGKNTGPSSAGAQGVMQLMPDAAKEMGVKDRRDAAESIRGGVGYLKKMLDKYNGDVMTALAAYNYGPGHVDKGDPLPQETQDYVNKVMDRMAIEKQTAPGK